MKNLKDFIKEREQGRDDCLFEMANLSQSDTKLPMIVWIQVKQPMKHNSPRMKFANNTTKSLLPNDLVPISISNNPKILSKNTKLKISQSDFEQLRNWIIRNEENLLKVWNGEISHLEFGRIMKLM